MAASTDDRQLSSCDREGTDGQPHRRVMETVLAGWIAMSSSTVLNSWCATDG
jgi:hypothetical protein